MIKWTPIPICLWKASISWYYDKLISQSGCIRYHQRCFCTKEKVNGKRLENKQINKICNIPLLSILQTNTQTLTYPVFVVHYVTQHIIQVQNAPISMFQPVDLHPIADVLEEEKNRERLLHQSSDHVYLHHMDLQPYISKHVSVARPKEWAACVSLRISWSNHNVLHAMIQSAGAQRLGHGSGFTSWWQLWNILIPCWTACKMSIWLQPLSMWEQKRKRCVQWCQMSLFLFPW